MPNTLCPVNERRLFKIATFANFNFIPIPSWQRNGSDVEGLVHYWSYMGDCFGFNRVFWSDSRTYLALTCRVVCTASVHWNVYVVRNMRKERMDVKWIERLAARV